MSIPEDIESRISQAMQADQFRLRRFLRSIRQAKKSGKPFDRNLTKLVTQLDTSVALKELRATNCPKISYPDELPVSSRRDEIASVISKHQVVVICGETGSGKSTQLPKIALELGRGIGGVIGHTQPRRIAARSIATRLAEELHCEVGQQVGYRIRFNDASSDKTLIRLMTDGIMLAETQSDRFLNQYDTIIVDEAHERSLNIDFLLGYLKRLLPKRKDLRLIITSATIDADRFSQHFSSHNQPAPVLNIEGRTYPVEIRYQSLVQDNEDSMQASDESSSLKAPKEKETDWLNGVATACSELASIDSGHMLVFLPTERDIREADKRLSGMTFPGDSAKRPTQIVPLFGRLSMADQAKVFRPYDHRRIVLATNVAESSLTVPGIRFVIDTGTARISRYSARSRMQRLPVEPVSQASANQRAGRCGRIGPGICVRLYSEEDFRQREPFTAPEIQRTNLASVILRTMNLNLGPLEDFPFIDPPRPTTVREGYKTLEELGAIERVESRVEEFRLTNLGRQMARLPVDPRIARMILAAIDEQAIPEVLVIASALEVQDPRDRPIDKQQAADEAHATFVNGDSDFLTLLNLWDAWHDNKKALSNNQLKKWCRDHFLSWLRMREWVDVHRQLKDLLRDSGDEAMQRASRLHPVKSRRNDFAATHRALLTGLLANIGYRSGEREFTGAGSNKLALWPGSSLARKKPKWFMAAELVETSQRFARILARIQPEWVEPIAGHLVRRDHGEPHWDSDAGNVMCWEKVTLWGLPIVPRRRTSYARINPVKSRELLIHFGLVQLGLLHGTTIDEIANDFADEEKELLAGRKRLIPGRSDPSTTAEENTTVLSNKAAPGRKKGWGADFPFLKHNVRVLQNIEALQARTRRHDLLPSGDWVFDFYDQQIPADATDRNRLRRWYQKSRKSCPGILQFQESQFADENVQRDSSAEFPSHIQLGAMRLPLHYQLDPGRDADGVTVSVPVEAIAQIDQNRLSWLVPGLLEEKVTALIRSLPKDLRRAFVPAPDTARSLIPQLKYGHGNMLNAVAEQLTRFGAQPVHPEDFVLSDLPEYLRANLRAVDSHGKTIAEHRDADELRARIQSEFANSNVVNLRSAEEERWMRRGFTKWDFGEIVREITIERAGMSLQSFPSLQDDGDYVSLTLCQTALDADTVLKRGVRRLVLLTEADRIQRQIDHLPKLSELKQLGRDISNFDCRTQLKFLLAERAYLSSTDIPRHQTAFDKFVLEGRKRISIVIQEIQQQIPSLLKHYQQTRRDLNDAQMPQTAGLINGMKQQLDLLVHAKFLEDTPWPWLIQYRRYFDGIRSRLDRLASGGIQKELTLDRDFQRYLVRYRERLKKHEAANRHDAMLVYYRWLLEEFRVSLFAPKLGTAVKVSGAKLDEIWNAIPA